MCVGRAISVCAPVFLWARRVVTPTQNTLHHSNPLIFWTSTSRQLTHCLKSDKMWSKIWTIIPGWWSAAPSLPASCNGARLAIVKWSVGTGQGRATALSPLYICKPWQGLSYTVFSVTVGIGSESDWCRGIESVAGQARSPFKSCQNPTS